MKEYEQRATKMIMSTVEGVKAQIRKAYNKGYEDRKAEESESARAIVNTEQQKSYEDGLNDAWECVKKIYSMNNDDKEKLFDYRNTFNIVEQYTVSEVLAKIKAYEDKQDAEIKVGDEIVYSDGLKGIVVGISNTVGQISVLNNKYDVPQLLVKSRAKKTGRTFLQIAEVLAELRGAENDEQ